MNLHLPYLSRILNSALFLSIASLGSCKPDNVSEHTGSVQIQSSGQEQVYLLPSTVTNTLSLKAEINRAYQEGYRKFKIPAGVYRGPIADGYIFFFEKMTDFEVDGTGVTFIITSRTGRPLRFQSCERATFRGATFVREVPPFSQGRMEAISSDGKAVDIRICEGYPTDIDDKQFFASIPILNVFALGRRSPKPYIYDLYLERIERLSVNLFRFHLRHSNNAMIRPFVIGDFAAWRGTVEHDVTVSECQSIEIEDVTIQNGRGFAFADMSGYGDNIYKNCKVTYAPRPPSATVDPFLSCNADGFHSNGAKKGPRYENCLAEGTGDDGFAVHGFGYGIILKVDKKKITVISWEVWKKNPLCEIGDNLRFYNSGTLSTAALAKVKSVNALGSYDLTSAPPEVTTAINNLKGTRPVQYWEVELETETTQVQSGMFVTSEERNGKGFEIVNSISRNHRGRGMFIQTGGTIENCQIENVINAGIASWPEFLGFNQSDYDRDLVIRGNLIRNAGMSNQLHCGAVTIAGQGFYPAVHEHENIQIQNNTFSDNVGPNLVITSARNVRIEDNTFIRPMTDEPPYSNKIPDFRMNPELNPGALVWLKSIDGVAIRGNKVKNPGPFFQRNLDARDVSNLSGAADGFSD